MSVPVPVFVGTLVGVFAALILLSVIIAVLCIRRRRKENASDRDTKYDDVNQIEKATEFS